MTCEDFKKKLQPFLDDLLVEAEYRELISHLEGCGKCKEHARSVGSLSNQLWELGDVKVPDDFVSTVLFKMRSPKPLPHSPGLDIRMVLVAVITAIIIAAGFLFLGRTHRKDEPRPKSSGVKPVATTPLNPEPRTLNPETVNSTVSKTPDKPPTEAIVITRKGA